MSEDGAISTLPKRGAVDTEHGRRYWHPKHGNRPVIFKHGKYSGRKGKVRLGTSRTFEFLCAACLVVTVRKDVAHCKKCRPVPTPVAPAAPLTLTQRRSSTASACMEHVLIGLSNLRIGVSVPTELPIPRLLATYPVAFRGTDSWSGDGTSCLLRLLEMHLDRVKHAHDLAGDDELDEFEEMILNEGNLIIMGPEIQDYVCIAIDERRARATIDLVGRNDSIVRKIIDTLLKQFIFNASDARCAIESDCTPVVVDDYIEFDLADANVWIPSFAGVNVYGDIYFRSGLSLVPSDSAAILSAAGAYRAEHHVLFDLIGLLKCACVVQSRLEALAKVGCFEHARAARMRKSQTLARAVKRAPPRVGFSLEFTRMLTGWRNDCQDVLLDITRCKTPAWFTDVDAIVPCTEHLRRLEKDGRRALESLLLADGYTSLCTWAFDLKRNLLYAAGSWPSDAGNQLRVVALRRVWPVHQLNLENGVGLPLLHKHLVHLNTLPAWMEPRLPGPFRSILLSMASIQGEKLYAMHRCALLLGAGGGTPTFDMKRIFARCADSTLRMTARSVSRSPYRDGRGGDYEDGSVVSRDLAWAYKCEKCPQWYNGDVVTEAMMGLLNAVKLVYDRYYNNKPHSSPLSLLLPYVENIERVGSTLRVKRALRTLNTEEKCMERTVAKECDVSFELETCVRRVLESGCCGSGVKASGAFHVIPII